MAESITVLVTGAAGRMGREVVRAIAVADNIRLVGAVDPSYAAKYGSADAGEMVGAGALGVPVDSNLAAALRRTDPDVIVDFTKPDAVMGNLREVLGAGISAVVGTTGLNDAALAELGHLASDNGASCLVVPNFAIGAVLMMRFAQAAARFLPDCEIIEMHHDQKLDAPSGTAMRTARMVAQARTGASPDRTEKLTLEGARGGNADGVHVHSVRLPGFVASQAVIFGGTGETLTIRHDTQDRTSFMPGVLLAISHVRERPGLTVGLESILQI